MAKRLTNKIVDERIKNRCIKRVGDYINSSIKIEFKCLKCFNVWKTKPKNILKKGNGCPKCVGNERLSNKIVDEKLKDRSIKRISNYNNNCTKIEFKCLECLNVWKTRPSYILNKGNGCPKCVGNERSTNEKIDEKLKTRAILRIDDCINSKTKINFKCLCCLNIWKASPDSLINKKTGCPKCSDKRLTNEIVNKKLKNRNIIIIDDYINNCTKIRFKCLKDNCFNVWKATPDNVIKKTGCPKCSDKKITNEILDKKLEHRDIKRIGQYINISTKIEFKCLKNDCLNIWKATPGSIINSGSGCPICKNKNEKLINSILKENNVIFEYQKLLKSFSSKENKNYRLDFYLQNHNLIIEYNGKQHYVSVTFGNISEEEANNKLKNQQERDEYVRQFCRENNISLIEIDGREYHGEKLKKYIEFLIKNDFKI